MATYQSQALESTATGDAVTLAIGALEQLAVAARVEFDPWLARQAVVRAQSDVPGDWQHTWSERLTAAAGDLQLRCLPLSRTIADVARLATVGAPLITYAPAAPGGSPWLILADERGGRVRRPSAGGADQWSTVAGLRSDLGLAQPGTLVPWLAVQPAAPAGMPEGVGPAAEAGAGHVPLTPLARLGRLLRPERRDLLVVLVYALAVGVFSLATPITVELLVNTIAFGNLLQPVVVLSLVLFVCLAFVAGMQCLQTYVVEILQRRLFVRCLGDIAYRLPRAERRAFDRRYGPELVNRFFEVVTVQKAVASLSLDGLSIVLQALIGMAVLAFYHPYLLGFDIVILASVAVIVFVVGRGAVPTAVEESRAKYATAAWLEEIARLPNVFKQSGGAQLAELRADHLAKQYLAARAGHFTILMRQIYFSLGLQAAASTALLGLGGWLVIQRELTLGQLVAAELIVGNIVRSVAKLGKHFESFYDLMASMTKLGHIFDLPLERTGGEPLPPQNRPAQLAIRDLEFAYEEGHPVLAGVQQSIPAGARVAIVGAAGSGKSTLLELICGLRTPETGYVELDGADLRQLSLADVRRHVTLVKDAELVAGTIVDNVRLGQHDLTLADVRTALAKVGLLDALLAMPAGLATQIAPDGAPLSGGQRRALLLARGIAGRPRLLLIDRVVDELDGELLACALATLFAADAPWTLLLVSNRPEVRDRCPTTLQLSATAAH